MKHTDSLLESAVKQGKPTNFVILNSKNINYFTGSSGASALLILEKGENILYVYGVNYEYTKSKSRDITVQLIKRGESLMEKIAEKLKNQKLCVDTLPIESWRALAKAVGGENKLEPANDLIRDLRKIKDKQEIQLIRKACKLANIGIKIASEIIRPGIKEKDVAAEIEYGMRKAGSDGVAFETIVASGFYSGYPHGSLLEKTIEEGDLVVVDLGATYKFYNSDISRTFIVGKPSEKQKRMYEPVKIAHQEAYITIKPHILAKEVDLAGRNLIEKAGFGEYFVHNIGHGVGLEVHEAPILSADSKDVLDVGSVVTVEPGIYIPNYGGVRIEDTVLVTKNGPEKLTYAPYDL